MFSNSQTPDLQPPRPPLSTSDRFVIHTHNTSKPPTTANHILTNASTLTTFASPVTGCALAIGVPVTLIVPLRAGVALTSGLPFAVVMVVANGVTVVRAVMDAAEANEARAALAADSIAGPRGSVAVWERTEEVREAKQCGVMVVVAMGGALVSFQLLRGLGGRARSDVRREGKRQRIYQVRCHDAGGWLTVSDLLGGEDG